MLARVIVTVAQDDDDAPRFDRLPLYELAAGTRQVDSVVQRRSAAGLECANLLDNRLRVVGGVDRDFGVLRVIDQITRILLIAGEQRLDQFGGGVLIILPMDSAGRAQIEK